MSGDDQIRADEIVCFGPFRLSTIGRLLVREQTPVEIGGRALDILIALIDRAGEVLSKRELMGLVWQGVVVEDASLRGHIAALRRVLGDGGDGTRYIINVPGRGYGFVAPVERFSSPGNSATISPAKSRRSQSFPPSPRLLIGRNQTISTLSSLVLLRRFISVIGSGGIGKTTVAVAVAQALSQEFGEDRVCFIDLGSLTDPAVVPGAIAAAVGCVVQGADPERSILAFLADKRVLIVLDNCEHVMGTVSGFTERLFKKLPSAYLLTTSREALRVEGENIHLLKPLDTPLDDTPSAVQALASPAVQLFMERATASGYEDELSDGDAPIVAGICRRLDGIALAIELAAGRVGTYGIRGTADLLDSSAGLVLQGRRSALPRHRTLQTLLDWSFQLLTEYERKLLRGLSVFVGQFTQQAALSVVGEGEDEAQTVSNAIVSLVDKSLVSISSTDGQVYFRLLDTTSAYASAKLKESGEAEAIARRHASYFVSFLNATIASPNFEIDNADNYAPYMGDVRKSLAFSFSASGDVSVGVELAALAGPLFLELSLFAECKHWCQQAMGALREQERGTRRELELREALAFASMWTRGTSAEVRTAIEQGLKLAEALSDGWRQIHFLAGLNMFLTRLGDFSGALAAAKRSAIVAESTGSASGVVVAEWMLGPSHHFIGDQIAALRHCERGFKLESDAAPVQANLFGFNHRERALVVLSRSLWLRGLPNQARKVVHQIIGDADHSQPVSRCVALLYSIPVLLWSGDFNEAAEPIERAISEATRYCMAPDEAFGLSLRGELMVANGDTLSGVKLLREALKILEAHRHHLAIPHTSRVLSEGLVHSGQPKEALVKIDKVLANLDKMNEEFWLPDLLRARGEILLALPRPDVAAVEYSLLRSINYARKQFAQSWELRAAIPLARLWKERGRSKDARTMLEDIYLRFTEGFDTQDLVAARGLLDELGRAPRVPPG